MLAILFLAVLACAQGLSPRIIGGKTTTISKHPYQVSIHYKGELHCGGSLISKQWILTAAHCVYGGKQDLFTVRVGSTYSNKMGKLIKTVSSIIHHELYDEDTRQYDVALIKLPFPLSASSKVKPVKLVSATAEIPTGSVGVVTGWGKTAPNGRMSQVLMSLQKPVIDQKVCQKIFLYYNTVTPEMMCAGYLTGGKDTCQGDSGGPLVYNGVQIGIVSWGAECAKAGFPGVYTRVSAVRSWIAKRANV